MEQDELKRKLLGLWEKTTHNSKDLLSILFDYYFDLKYIEYKETEGKVVSALCGIPYYFGYGEKLLKGLYIISLTSEEGFRKKGVLASLLTNLNERIKEEFDFTFIVPATELLADYYGSQGYFSSFYILEERFTPLHDFRNDYLLSLNESDERIKKLKIALLDEIQVTENTNNVFPKKDIIDFIISIEKKSTSSVNLCHKEKDLDYLLGDQSIRNLNYFISFDADNNITGVAFTKKEDIKRTKIISIYVSDTCSYYCLLDFIKHKFADHSLSIYTSDPKYQMHSIIQQTYASANPSGGDLDNSFSTIEIPFNINKLLHPLGMVRLLRFERILNYIAETHSDVDFKLYLRDYKEVDSNSTDDNEKTDKVLYIVKNGKCSPVSYDKSKNDRSVLDLSTKEFSELLLRKNDSSNLIMEAFGIPRLNLQVRLLPC